MLLAAALLVTAPLLQQPATAPAEGGAEVAEAAKPEKLVCRSYLVTGSRTNMKRVCHTEAEWELIKREQRNVVDKAQRERGWYKKD